MSQHHAAAIQVRTVLDPRVGRDTPRRAFNGTYRGCSPNETLARITEYFSAAGITRIADVTGLDRVGMPVFNVVRPASKSIAIATGKGTSRIAAQVSGAMEALECYCAENLLSQPVISSQEALAASGRAIPDLSLCPRDHDAAIDELTTIGWQPGYDLLNGCEKWVPHELVTNDFSAQPSVFPSVERGAGANAPAGDVLSGAFPKSTNGLASGNTLLEATLHALYEVIERDAMTLFHHSFADGKQYSRLDPAQFGESNAALARQICDAGMELYAWDVSSDIGCACAYAVIWEPLAAQRSSLRATGGSGCHSDARVALSRAITEAAQERLTLISGARDDLQAEHYIIEDGHAEAMRTSLRLDEPLPASDDTEPSTLTHQAATHLEELERVLASLRACGVREAIVVDLSRPEFPDIAVCKVVVPGLEPPHEDAGYRPGPRVQAQLARLDETRSPTAPRKARRNFGTTAPAPALDQSEPIARDKKSLNEVGA